MKKALATILLANFVFNQTHAAAPIYALASNVSETSWGGSNIFNTGWGVAAPTKHVEIQLTVNSGSTFTFDSVSTYLGKSGGMGGAVLPYLKIFDASSNVLATSPTVAINTPFNGFYGINSLASATPYLITFQLASQLNLNAGTYFLSIWSDDGNQMQWHRSKSISTADITVQSSPSVVGPNAAPVLTLSVPEPSALSLLVVGLGGVIALRRCRRSAV